MWWPTSVKYPERRAEEVDAHEYDYIVIGGPFDIHSSFVASLLVANADSAMM